MSIPRLYPIRLLSRVNLVRFYAQGPASTSSSPPNRATTPTPLPHVPHEVHEKTPSTNAPFNSPSGHGGDGPNFGRTSSPSFTSSPLLDAAFTTIVGLGMGKLLVKLVLEYFYYHIRLKLTWSSSVCWRSCLRRLVQEKSIGQSNKEFTWSFAISVDCVL